MRKKNSVFKKELDAYRKEIDKIDNEIVKFLDERGELVEYIGKIKKKYGKNILQPEREKEIVRRMKYKSKKINNENIESIWREIFKGCKHLQDIEDQEK
jgi:chorismate mutase